MDEMNEGELCKLLNIWAKTNKFQHRLILIKGYWIIYKDKLRDASLMIVAASIWLLLFGMDWLGLIGSFLLGYYVFLILSLHKLFNAG